ncbi:hypothetical protein D1007_03193 [Hordeum vulgare]|nr:hypothetical protein D1007_03193 [Hordeum vulgare]
MGFFYVKNLDLPHDHVNLPAFFDEPLVHKLNWKMELPPVVEEVGGICTRLEQMFEVEGLTAVDLLATMVSRRPHLICQMSGRHDPWRLSTKELWVHWVPRWVNLISDNPMDEDDWSRGKRHLFSRLQIYNPPAVDVSELDPEEIKDADEVEPRVAARAGDEMSGDDKA